ncbi:unnamed protein product [Rhizophagus irregularis]|uniref:Uncharacterized protein n=1 Tax=Rhizophagus irregularis TaxID=588596 RepID=A0A916E6R4_9GLOM|nr:unnamed protein product [Rhizophagus irregularis]
MNQQEEISLIKKQNELILERLNSLDDARGNSRRPSTSSTTSPVDVSSLSARGNIRRPSTSSTTFPVDTHNKSFVAKPKKKYISKLDMISTLDITNEMYTLCMSSMRICADYHLDYNLSYKDIHKNILFKIIEKFKIKTKDLNISLGYNDWFAYELLKKHVQHVRDHKAKTINEYFTKRTRSRGEERPVEKNVEESGGDEEERESEGEEAAAEIEIRDDSDSDIDEDLERQLLNLFRKRYKKTGGTDSNKDEELEHNLIREIRSKYERKKRERQLQQQKILLQQQQRKQQQEEKEKKLKKKKKKLKKKRKK